MENIGARVYFNEAADSKPATLGLLKKDSDTGAFLWMLHNF